MNLLRSASFQGWFLSVMAILFTAFGVYPKWEKPLTEATISWDVSGYYLYLPATLIYHDLRKLDFFPPLVETYYPAPGFDQAFAHESGNRVMKYSCGQAFAMLPGFLAAHTWCLITESAPPDGFSRPYQVGISMGALLIAMLGLWFLRLVLVRWFSERITGLTLVLLTIGTNYLDYSAINGAMTHNTLFTLYAFLLWVSGRYHDRPSVGKALILGLLVGYAALVRPTEIIAVLIPLLWGMDIREKGFLSHRMKFLWTHRFHLVVTGLAAALIGFVQLIYWKYVSGDWIVYSYEDQGFSWLHPHVWDALFSYRSGWLLYTPLMALTLFGFFSLWNRLRPMFAMTAVFSLVFMYIAFAWDIWWYGGALGQRAMVQAYPVLAIPLAAFFSQLPADRFFRAAIWALTGLFCLYNIWLTWQAHRGGMYHAGQMSEAYFWRVLGKTTANEHDLKLLDTDEDPEDERQNIRILNHKRFEADTTVRLCGFEPIMGQGSLCLQAGGEFTTLADIPKSGKGEWIRVSALFRAGDKEWDMWKMHNLCLEFRRNGEIIKHKNIRLWRLLDPYETQEIWIDSAIPDEPFDQILSFVWNPGSPQPLVVDEVWVESYDLN
ncbi:MAG: hypothetical protein IPJ06_15900 [Saprospiraceae bacterium]|nr:hypothetical protein [Saprospiraceae bacterium]